MKFKSGYDETHGGTMCAEFTLKTSYQKLLKSHVKFIQDDRDREEWDLHARLYVPAPVLVRENDGVHLREFFFSLKPPGTTYPTFNARLSGWDEKAKKIIKIHERPTWRKPLLSQRCLVPMTGFIEPIYLGKHAGHAMEFQASEAPVLYAAALYDTSINPKTGELYEGFALILHTPSRDILNVGHHRMPVFLRGDDATTWLEDSFKSAEAAYHFLLQHRYVPKVQARESRSLSKNWQRKQGEYEKKLEKEKHYMERLEAAK